MTLEKGRTHVTDHLTSTPTPAHHLRACSFPGLIMELPLFETSQQPGLAALEPETMNHCLEGQRLWERPSVDRSGGDGQGGWRAGAQHMEPQDGEGTCGHPHRQTVQHPEHAFCPWASGKHLHFCRGVLAKLVHLWTAEGQQSKG